MIKKFTLLLASVLLCSQLGLLSVAADTDSAFILEQDSRVTQSSSSAPNQTEPPASSDNALPTTGNNKTGALPVTGEQMAHILSIIGAFVIAMLFVFWKNRKREKEEKDENFNQ